MTAPQKPVGPENIVRLRTSLILASKKMPLVVRSDLEALHAELPDLIRARELLDAIEHREIELECMGTEVPYVNAWPVSPRGGDLFTTAGGTMTLREALGAALAASRSASTGGPND